MVRRGAATLGLICSAALVAMPPVSAYAQPYGSPNAATQPVPRYGPPLNSTGPGSDCRTVVIGNETKWGCRLPNGDWRFSDSAPRNATTTTPVSAYGPTMASNVSDYNDPNSPRRVAKRKAAHSKVAGCIMGGILGGLIGAAASNRQNRGTAIAAGAAIGCFAGFAFASSWSQHDQEALDSETDQVFDQPQPVSTVWQAPESGQQVTFTSTPAVEQVQKVDFEHYSNVTPPQEGAKVIGKPFRTTEVLRLRSAPDATSDDNIVGRFNRGEIVEVVGATPDGKWAMIGDDGVIAGYASFDYLATLASTQTLRRTPTAKPKRDRPMVASNGAASGSNKGPTVMVAGTSTTQPTIKTTKVLASTQCKSVVAVSGQQTDRKKGCAQPSGDWKFA